MFEKSLKGIDFWLGRKTAGILMNPEIQATQMYLTESARNLSEIARIKDTGHTAKQEMIGCMLIGWIWWFSKIYQPFLLVYQI